MSFSIRRVDYFYTTIHDRPGEAYQLLRRLSEGDVNLLAFHAVPVGPNRCQLSLFPENHERLAQVGRTIGFSLDGPHPAILVRGDDRLGALADVHSRLSEADVNVFASSGVTAAAGTYGCVLYVRPEEIDKALNALA